MTSIAEFQNVSYAYPAENSGAEALSGVTGTIPQGAIYGLLGPNGAGKTTLIRCITGFVWPINGSVRVFGSPPCRRNLSRMGVLLENPGTYRKMNAAEYLLFFAELFRLTGAEAKIRELASIFECKDLSLPVGKMSAGGRQRIQLMRSLLHDPDLIIWDEPFSNLDPRTQKLCLNVLARYVEKRTATAIVATHQLELAEALCSHYGFLKDGKLVFTGEREVARSLVSGDFRTAFTLASAVASEELNTIAATCDAALFFPQEKRAEATASVHEFAITGGRDGQVVPVFIEALCRRGIRIQSVVPQQKSLYDVYNEMVR